jgi:RND superfamily putative drug exporter
VVPTVPLLVFCAVFGIGMDYEVFLLARIFRARRDGASDEESIVHGVAASAPLITRAATIMVAVFFAFAMGDFIVIRMIGFALATAVAIDATLIRLVVAPALMRIAGRWNWWPGERHRAANDFGTVRQHAVQSAP